MRHQLHSYADLKKQIHNDLRIQHPEWIQPNGESPMCDSYEARLVKTLHVLIRQHPSVGCEAIVSGKATVDSSTESALDQFAGWEGGGSTP
jgi:hypothetical protein